MSEKKKGGFFGFFKKKNTQKDSEKPIAQEPAEQEIVDSEVVEPQAVDTQDTEQPLSDSDLEAIDEQLESDLTLEAAEQIDAVETEEDSTIDDSETQQAHEKFEQDLAQLNQDLAGKVEIRVAEKSTESTEDKAESTENLKAAETPVQHELDIAPAELVPTELAPVELASDEVEEQLLQAEIDAEKIETDGDTEAQKISAETQEKPSKTGFFARLKAGLSKTRSQLTDGLADLVLGSKHIDDDLLEEIETQLLMADVGVEATRKIIDDLTGKAARKELKDPQALMDRLRVLLAEILAPCSSKLEMTASPMVILMVGVNGVGKTTTIGKLAKKFQSEGKSVMLAAGDTFRAAAVEQLQVWGERNNIHVTAQHTGADSASVIFDALQAAQSRKVDVLIADTAGRLHTKSNLMDELSKVKRVMQKLDSTAPHEIMLVVDAGTGQNALNQASEFHKAVGLTGITITKLDGTAKGGVIFALADKLQVPIRYIGVGEGIDDLREFDGKDFINALFSKE